MTVRQRSVLSGHDMVAEWKKHIPLISVEDYCPLISVKKESGEPVRSIRHMIRWEGNEYKIFALPD